MPFDRPTLETIKDRIEKNIEARLFSKLALLRNAVLRILARVFAGAIHGCYGYLEWMSKQIFVTTAETFWLDQRGKMWGVERRPGSYATGDVIFTGINGSNISIDTRVQSDEGVEYVTTASGIIAGGQVILAVQCVEAGVVGNFDSTVSPTPTFQLIVPITGVDDIIGLNTDMTGGVDPEDDETYRARILQRIQQVPAGGAASDYVRWAQEVIGVERAWCFPLADGPGTVATVITATGSDPVPSSTLLTDVENYIEARRPVTASQRVASITDVNDDPGTADIFGWLSLPANQNTTEIRAKIEENIINLLAPHRPGTDILISQFRAAISNAGVSDFDLTQIYVNTQSRPTDQDIALSGFQYPVFDSFNYQDL